MNKHHAPFESIAFSNPETLLGALSTEAASMLLGNVGDITLVVGSDGIVLDVATTSPDLAKLGFADWIGKSWIDTVADDSKAKISDMLATGKENAAARWRQVNHPTEVGEVPIRYLPVNLGNADRIVAVGRDMRSMGVMQQRLLQAQQALERDYLKMRQAEARYRMLFDLAAEPVLIIDASNRRIREANPAAYRVLGAKPGALIDQMASSIIAPVHREAFVAHLGAAEAADDVPPITVQLANGDHEIRFSARLFRQARSALLLVRMSGAGTIDARHAHDTALSDVLERMPDAFVLADRDLTILTANSAFADLVELPSTDRLRGDKLGNWFGRSGIDLDLILGQLREHGMVRNVSAIMRGASGGQEEIEVSAVLAPSVEGDCYGFTIRSVGRRLQVAAAVNQRDMPRSVEQLTDLVGRMSLKEIVRESTDMIERLCIEAALVFTADNRASAAEVLGLSRQSLYSKMHRHGLGNLVSDDE
ncbi:MAG: transcriptional regulator PpsR [Sphingomonas sp.]|nr:transcriptional regulator PpsR [Sphingomonas sp.]